MNAQGEKNAALSVVPTRRNSLSTRIVATSVAVVTLVVVISGALSYRELRSLAVEVADRTLSSQVGALADDLENRISLLVSSARTLAANELVVNALVDDFGRDIYLSKFLEGFQTAEGLTLTLTMTDFEGLPLAENRKGSPVGTSAAWIEEVVEKREGRVRFIAHDGEISAIIAEPIIYASTGSAEGALIYRINLSEWIELERVKRILEEGAGVASLSLGLRGDSEHDVAIEYGDDAGEAPAAHALVRVQGSMETHPLRLTLKAKPEFVEAPLDDLLRNVTFTGIGVLLIAAFSVGYFVRVQTSRLNRLRQEVEQLSGPKSRDASFTVEGNDEVTDLARTFNHLVSNLQDAYQELETQSQKSIDEGEARFRSIVENSAEGIITISPSGIIGTVNPASELIFGYTRDEMLGKNIRMLLPSRFQEAQANDLDESALFAPRTIDQSRELFALKKNGQKFPLELTVSPIEVGGERHFVGMMRDISERKEFEAQLRDARDSAEAANRAKSQFLSSMSHELRTPLNAIMGFGQLLESDPDQPLVESQKTAVHHILRGGAHLLELINQVLDLAKIESGNLALSIEPIDTDAVIIDCLTMATGMADKKNITVNTELPERANLPFVMADQTRLRQVLLNLLSNAVKYNDPGGSVTVTCSVQSGGRFLFSVRDTGHGIPAKYHDKVFSPFNRLAAEGGEAEGTGIGLSITRQLVDIMGGQVGFSSVEGEGSTFWFDLPIATPKEEGEWLRNQAEDANRDLLVSVNLPPCTVLYVEDNPANLQLMEMVLGRASELTLHSAHTAETGIEAAEAIKPDLILMDINLPGMDGFEALKVLRNAAETRHIPIVAVSANAMPHDLRAAEAAGFNAYITKPFDIPNVMSTISRELNRNFTDNEFDPEPKNAILKDTSAYAPLDANDVERLFTSARALPEKYVSILQNQAAAIPLLIAKILHACATNNLDEATASTHILKTNAATFGAKELWAVAQNVEDSARAGSTKKLDKLLTSVEEEYDIVAPTITVLLEDLKKSRN